MLNRLKVWFIVLILCCHSWLTFAETTIPTTLLVQASLVICGETDNSERHDILIGIYSNYNNEDTLLWSETYEIDLVNGNFTQVLGESEDNPINANIFIENGLQIGFTPDTTCAGSGPAGTSYIDLMSMPYSFHSQISYTAEKLLNEDLIYLDLTNTRVGINNTSPQYTLDVGGTVNAVAFVGDGSGLTNIQVSDSKLVWTRSPFNNDDIYYISGNVGIGTKQPSALLHVSGNAIISGNLTVSDQLNATYLAGDGSQITNINADHITTGTLPSARLSGAYTGITQVGSITQGSWQATPITDEYVADNLTLYGATLQGFNTLSGTFNVIEDSLITGTSKTLQIVTSGWNISGQGKLDIDSVTVNNQIIISGNVIESITSTGIHLRPSGNIGLFVTPTGSIGINTITPQTMLDVSGGIKLGYSEQELDGIIRFNPTTNRFEAFSDDAWVILDAKSDYDSHALHSEDGEIRNLIYVNSSGNVGIGGIPSQDITEHFMVSGNVVFSGAYTGAGATTPLTYTGNGSRMMWYPLKSAFRAGYADTDEWDSDNIGTNSIVFGDSNTANDTGTTIIGGRANINSGEGSVILGGYNHSIDEDSEMSVIIGGGGGTDDSSGNSIEGSTYSSIIGGYQNSIENSDYSTVVGGSGNTVQGNYSVAMGKDISISHNNTFIFSDGYQPRSSSGDNQFLIYATGNVGIGTNPIPEATLNVSGMLRASAFVGDGSQLLNISAEKLSGFYSSRVASPNSVYISDENGFLPANTVNGDSITANSIESHHIMDGSISGDDIAPGAITSKNIADGTITSEKLADGAISGSNLQENSITSMNIVNGGIVAENIASNSIYEYHIAPYQITNAKIALDTIDTTRILDGTITSKDIGLYEIASFNIQENAIGSRNVEFATIVSDNIAANAIQEQHITPNAVSSRNIADDAVLTYHIADYSIINEHLVDDAITSRNFADEIITNDRISDNSIKSEKIASDSITSKHLPDDVIESKHIAEYAVKSNHIGFSEIDGEKIKIGGIISANIAAGAITSSKITPNAITSDHIQNGTIKSADLGNYILTSEYLATGSITSVNIQDGGVSGDDIALNAITGEHIQDGSITSADIQLDTITTEYVKEGSITTELIATGAITSDHIADSSITSENIADGSITWDKIATSNADGELNYLPTSFISEGSISGDKLADGSILGENIEPGSITSEHLADNSISANALIGVVSVENGGTGTTSLAQANGSVVYVTGNAFAGDPDKLNWDNRNHFLGIGTSTPEYSLHVDGSIFTEGGTVFFGAPENSISFSNTSFWGNNDGFIIVGPEDINDLANTNPQGTIKINQLYVSNKLGVGPGFDPTEQLTNMLVVSGNMSIGENYGTQSAPANGLIVEGKVGIGTHEPSHQLDVVGGIQANGIYSTADTADGIGIIATGGNTGISVNSVIGIDITAEEYGIKASVNGDNGKGVQVTVSNPGTGSFAVKGLLENGAGATLTTGGIGYYTTADKAAIYGQTSQDSSDTETFWAGYFDGPVKINHDVAIGTDDTPEATLHVGGSVLIEESITISEHSTANTTINWSNSNKVHYDCAGSSSLNFTNTNDEHVQILTLRVTNTGCTDISMSADGATIFWEKGFDLQDPEDFTIVDTTTAFIFSFFYDGTNYYASKPMEFQ